MIDVPEQYRLLQAENERLRSDYASLKQEIFELRLRIALVHFGPDPLGAPWSNLEPNLK